MIYPTYTTLEESVAMLVPIGDRHGLNSSVEIHSDWAKVCLFLNGVLHEVLELIKVDGSVFCGTVYFRTA